MNPGAPFHFSTVAHLEYPAGPVATDFDTLREGIATVPVESLFYHTTRIAVRHPRAQDLPANDFARWVGTALQDAETAERLAFAGAQPVLPLEELRASLLRILDDVGHRKEPEPASEAAAFHFVTARSVKVPLDLEATDPELICEAWPYVDHGAAFYHLIEARVFGPASDDLIEWLKANGGRRMAEVAEDVLGGGMPLQRLQREIGGRWRRALIPSRLVRGTEASETERRAHARAVVARFAGRLRKVPERQTP